MKVTLLHNTPLGIADLAIGKCWDKTTEKPRERIKRVGIKQKHASTLEHVSYNLDIDGISRACLQELARHRMSSFSVKSSRYTLKELKDSTNKELMNFFVKTSNPYVNMNIHEQLKIIRTALNGGNGYGNDIVKYMLPEAYKTSLVWTVNIRSLRNFLALRTDKSALWEIRELASNIYQALPEEHRFLFVDTVKRVSPQMREEHFQSEGSYASDEEILEWYKEQYE